MPYIKKEDGYHYTEEEPVATTVVPLTAGTPSPTDLPPVDPRLARAEADAAEARRIAQQLTQQLNQQNRQVTPPQGQPNMDDLNRQFYKEPVQSTVAIVQQGIQDALRQHGQAGFDTLIQVAKDKVRSKNPELFDKYATEIEATVKSTVDPQFHTNMTVWENAANIAYGAHMNEIRDLARQATPQAPAIRISSDPTATPGTHQPELGKGSQAKLSDEERAMAKNLDISEELYASGKEAYANQATRGKSSWDGLITFSSKDARRAERARRKAAASK